MAGSSRFDDLRREITSLVVENDELRQMVDILRENQELRDVLRTQYNESGALLPVLESTRVDEQDQIGGQPRLNITTWERRNFVPGRGPFRFDRRRPLDTSSVSANSWLVLSPDRRQHGRSRALPDANQAGAGFLQDFSFSEDFPRFAEQEGFMCSTPIQAHPAFSPLGGQAGPAAQAAPQDTAWSFSTREGSRSGARCSTPIQTHPQIGALPDWALSPLGGQAGPAAQAGPQDTTCSFPTVFSPAHTPTAMRPPYSYASLGSITPLSYISSIDDSVFTRARQASPLSSGSIFSPVPPPGPQAVAGTQGGPQYFTFSPPLGQITVPATQPALTGSQPGGTESGPSDSGPFVLQPPPPGRKGQRPPSPGTAPAQVPFTAGPAAALSAPAQGPSVRPKERQVLTQQEMALKTSSDAKSKDTKQESMERIVGEIAFQLDRRILSAIFPDRVRLYGFTVRNIPKKVMQSGNDPYSQLSEQQASAIMERYNAIMNRLKPLGYDPNAHPRLTEQVVNTFGILRERPEMSGAEAASYNDVQNLRNVVRETVPPDMRNDCLLLLNCLHQLSQDDGKPLFIW